MVPEIMTGRRCRFVEELLDGEQRRLGVEGVEDGFDQEDVGPAIDQPARGFGIGLDQFVKADVAKAGSLTSGDIEAVRLVGPRTPATKRGLSGSVPSRHPRLRAPVVPTRR